MLERGPFSAAVEKRLSLWKETNFVSRIWQKDPTIWASDPGTKEIADRLGWLFLPVSMKDQVEGIKTFAENIHEKDYRHVVLLGMGGSSLAPAVLQESFGNSKGYPELIVMDTTHPAAIRSLSARIEPLKTIFLVSSKSGTTLETATLYSYFWDQVSQWTQEPGKNFVAITDPGTPLAQMAKDRRFIRTFPAPPDVGGRYSALTVFGLVPAALIGIDIYRLLDRARLMAEACAPQSEAAKSPGLVLGAILGELANAGRDKITFITDARLSSVTLWLEQLIAESTGKNGKGLVPVAGEIPGPPEVYGKDRLFVELVLSRGDFHKNEALDALQSAGHPALRINLLDMTDLGQEFFKWEIAVAAAGSILGIHPFDQPDVQMAKDLAKKAMESAGSEAPRKNDIMSVALKPQLISAMEALLTSIRPGDYVALQAYLAPDHRISEKLQRLQNGLRDRLHVAATVGYGPRFLHSTGQLHKGGPDTGVFIQMTDEITEDLAVPGKDFTFGKLIQAQAEGDYQALKNRDRRILRINLGRDPAAGIEDLAGILKIAG
jgi:transaldolase/glucose-6-phosphate isomerase